LLSGVDALPFREKKFAALPFDETIFILQSNP
jgi:hypothetical protein